MTGRPREYDRAKVVPMVCTRMEAGDSLANACAALDVPATTVRRWVADEPAIAAAIEAAREVGFDAIADETLTIADNVDEDAQSRRVRVDTRKWLLSKQAPRRYGDRVTLAGDAENPLVTMTDEQLDARLALALAKLNAKGSDDPGEA